MTNLRWNCYSYKGNLDRPIFAVTATTAADAATTFARIDNRTHDGHTIRPVDLRTEIGPHADMMVLATTDGTPIFEFRSVDIVR
jgi:hypothetical protein